MQHKTIVKAAFNPLIKTYILFTVALILFATVVGIPIMIIWFFGLGQYFARKYFLKLECELTERHLRFKKGVLVQVEKTIPLENIQDLTFVQGPLLKMFKLSVLKIETAGGSNPNGSDMKLIGIIDVDNFRNKVMEQREIVVNNKGGNNGSTAGENPQTLEEIKEILLRIEQKITK
jgi:membrane protein YdbS with pleckstrin-like domain